MHDREMSSGGFHTEPKPFQIEPKSTKTCPKLFHSKPKSLHIEQKRSYANPKLFHIESNVIPNRTNAILCLSTAIPDRTSTIIRLCNFIPYRANWKPQDGTGRHGKRYEATASGKPQKLRNPWQGAASHGQWKPRQATGATL